MIKRIMRNAISAFMGLLLFSGLLWATEKAPPAAKKTEAAPIQIVSDRLEVDSAANIADFTGNVRATQGNSVIQSNQLKIYYKDTLMEKGKGSSTEQSIRKIIAIGSVRINFDNRVAVTEKAVYITKDRVIILTGENSKVTADNNSITGRKITIHRDSGRISFERGNNEPVKAVIHGEGKGFK